MVLQPELFSDAELKTVENKNRQIATANEAEKRRKVYAVAKLPFFEVPADDNEKLLNFQYDWLKNGSCSAREKLFVLGYECLWRILWHEMKKRKMHLTKEEQSDKVLTAFEYVFRRYSRKNGYVVLKNYISVLKGGIRHALDYRTMADTEISLEDWMKGVADGKC